TFRCSIGFGSCDHGSSGIASLTLTGPVQPQNDAKTSLEGLPPFMAPSEANLGHIPQLGRRTTGRAPQQDPQAKGGAEEIWIPKHKAKFISFYPFGLRGL